MIREVSNPSKRRSCLLKMPAGDGLGEIFGVFDSTMDHVSAKFTAQSRKLVAVAGIAVALALPLDTFDLLQRLTRSDAAPPVPCSTTFSL